MTEDDGDEDVPPEDAFSLVANETRMDVLKALWEADGPRSFSALRERVGVRDSGQFNYHLGKLVGHFVRKTADGYRLSLDDRELEIDCHDGPEEAVHWVLTLRADGETVSKFGPYESTAKLVDQLETVLTSDVFYTVCCDG